MGPGFLPKVLSESFERVLLFAFGLGWAAGLALGWLGWAGLGWLGWAGLGWLGCWLGWAVGRALAGLGWAELVLGWRLLGWAGCWAGLDWAGLVLAESFVCAVHFWFWRAGACFTCGATAYNFYLFCLEGLGLGFRV